MYFESHAHYDDDRFDDDRDEILNSLSASGVDYVVNIGVSLISSMYIVRMAEKYDFLYAAVGVHPHNACGFSNDTLSHIATLCRRPKVVAIGEIGLDYYYDNSPRTDQRKCFIKQLELAAETNSPVVIHSRDAAEETMTILRESPVRKGVIHCYSGSAEMAREYVSMGFYIGVGGVVTFPKAKNLVKTVETIPLESILIETDCPYLSPAPKRGQRNDSRNLCYICEKIGQIKGITSEEVALVTAQNAMSFYGIK